VTTAGVLKHQSTHSWSFILSYTRYDEMLALILLIVFIWDSLFWLWVLVPQWGALSPPRVVHSVARP